MTKTKKITISVAVILIVAIAIIGTIFDLQISRALADLSESQYYSSNIFAILGECFGEDVLYLFIMLACAIIFFYLLKFPLKQKWLTISLQVLLCCISYLIAFYSFNKTINYVATYLALNSTLALSNYVNSVIGIISIILISFVIDAVIFFLVEKIKPEILKSLWKWALVILIVAVVSNGIVQVSKHIFDRTRFRAMYFVGDKDFSYFTYWFTINKNKIPTTSIYAEDFFKSFPSGHTCAATSIFLLVLLPYYLKELDTKQNKIIFYTVATCYTLFVAISRIVAGAHFFMDTFIASLITIFTIIITPIIINIIFKKLSSKNLVENEPTKQDVDKKEKADKKTLNKQA